MPNQVNPFDGGFSAKLVVNDKAGFLGDIVNGFKSVVCIATVSAAKGELTVEFVDREHWRVAKALHDPDGLLCVSLPLFVFSADNHAPANAPPQVIS